MINPVIGYTTPDNFSPEIQACIQNIQDKFSKNKIQLLITYIITKTVII